jgi:hypothetical protein
MRINGLTVKQLWAIANTMKISLFNVRETGDKVKWVHFVLRPKSGSDRYRKIKVSCNNNNKSRRIFAVCCHGHYDFLERVFKKNPEARVRSAATSFDGAKEFIEEAYRDYDLLISRPSAMYYNDCNCEYYEELKAQREERKRKKRERREQAMLEMFRERTERAMYEGLK